MKNLTLKKLTLISLALATSLTITGCANTQALDDSISNLSQKVDRLSGEVATLKAEQAQATEAAKAAQAAAEQAASDAAKANERIDNVVASYKK